MNLPGADEDLQAALEKAPQNPDVLLAAAMGAMEQKRWEDAQKTFTLLTKVSPDDSRGYMGLGAVYRQQGSVEEALTAWRSGLADNPNGARASLEMVWQLRPQIAELLIDERRMKEADDELKILESSLRGLRSRLPPRTAQNLSDQMDYLRSKWYVFQGQPLRAITALRRLSTIADSRTEGAYKGIAAFQVHWLLGS